MILNVKSGASGDSLDLDEAVGTSEEEEEGM